jgi:hypothetical protein
LEKIVPRQAAIYNVNYRYAFDHKPQQSPLPSSDPHHHPPPGLWSPQPGLFPNTLFMSLALLCLSKMYHCSFLNNVETKQKILIISQVMYTNFDKYFPHLGQI